MYNFISDNELFDLLEVKYHQYNNTSFIENDPISIPHLFTNKEDIEISAFLTAAISWGQRKTIINNARKIIRLMDDSPFDFIINAEKSDLKKFKTFTHRTFNGTDCIFFIKSLINIYKYHKGIETCFNEGIKVGKDMSNAISFFRKIFFEIPYPKRVLKHISDPSSNSAAKRINMFLRWMIRKDKYGVDFGIWNQIKPDQLYCPLDIHSGNVSRKLGLLTKKSNNWNAVIELTEALKKFDKKDPVKYDFALYGLGAFEQF
jgi:uncharacterized protein (TIGR02757 family)